MATKTKSSSAKSNMKVTFGKRREGKHSKRLNKHKSTKPYSSQGH